MPHPSRRNLIGFLTSLTALSAVPAFAQRTPSATEGPYYPTTPMRFADADNNLVKRTGAVRAAGGEVMVLKGQILDPSGAPAEGARIEIWQCDANGVYLHTRDRKRGYDDAFQGFGHVVTGADGRYAFRTIKPVTYPGRTPHIHVKVFHSGQELTTQFYLAGHPQNMRDRIFRRMTDSERRAVSMSFTQASGEPETDVTVRL